MADKDTGDACPVDHKTRDAWLAQARAAEAAKHQQSSPPASCPVDHASPPSRSWTQTLTSYLPFSSSASPSPSSSANQTPSSTTTPRNPLGTDRTISTIPRSSSTPESCPVDHGASANAENDSEAHSSGNWVYPSEKMFFEAMKRKGYEARVADMKTVVPIHNAVNERAWEEIKAWEKPYLEGTSCGGPKLASFANKQQNMTPTARINTILGYTAPFDRHDWVIDRCGTRVDYVIDFYSGRPGAAANGGQGPSFYLDVRPKLNTLEGWKMRAARWTGMR